ncbi:sigma-70 family RNA polymerase sigma factor [Hellea balneolensis]|uniref:sigma-70 family RNA polymerase sigma factor n=1 Tax=Hellea balneolensis TaxID=287478 RepID=UPI000422583D|nr:sigma-70 family RNA polymerase sigma factor [Hellea balneolensis]
MEETDDIAALIGRVTLKDRAAFDRLYNAASPKLFGACLRLLKDNTEAEDAMQDIFVKIWNKADRYRPGNASAMGWLYAIARNHCLDILRARKAPLRSMEQTLDIPDKAADPEKSAVNAGEGRRIDICMMELEPDKAEAVKAAYVEGYSYAELSAHYEVPLNTMRTWLRRSLMKLRKCLEK